MKVSTRAISSITAILIFIIVSGILVIKYLESSSKEITGHIENIESSTKNDDWNDVTQNLQMVQKKWSKTKSKWSMLLDHAEIDNIETSLTRMSAYIDAREKVLALAELSTLKQFVEHIPKKEVFGLENIF